MQTERLWQDEAQERGSGHWRERGRRGRRGGREQKVRTVRYGARTRGEGTDED